MRSIKLIFRNSLLSLLITVQPILFPLAAYANTETSPTQTVSDPAVSTTNENETTESVTVTEEQPVAPTTTTTTQSVQPTEATTVQENSVSPPPSVTPTATTAATTATNTANIATKPPRVPYGPNRPVGADAHTFKYNTASGYWENDYYAWNPATQLRIPKNPQYRFNAAANSWEMSDWRYNPALGRYVAFPLLISQPPRSVLIANTGPGSTNTITSNGGLTGSINGTGPNSSNTILVDSDGDGDIDYELDASITNNLNSTATSGNAAIIGNTTGGSALTGDASTIANILNILQSSWGLSAGEMTTFTSNIHGDVVGDLLLDPSKLPSQINVGGESPLTDLTINADINGQITNNIDLAATSGDATVRGNTTAGNAETGDATAIANVINLINSAIAANQSFVGNINIYGNLEGDILLPSWLMSSLLAANSPAPTGSVGVIDTTGPDSTNTINQNTDSSLDLDLDTNHLINNNVSVTATTGDALVSGNTTAGSAQTGDASTNITLLNLTGRQIVGSNSLLVFVSVLGKWVGLIVDAPAGTTSAAIGNGITQNSTTLPNNLEADITTNSVINNNINVAATSGDATVSNNTRAGDATTGDATAGVSLLNITNSSFALTDWFGVLFINVFGSWHGSFGVDTAYGNRAVSEEDNGGQLQTQTGSSSQAGAGGLVAGANTTNKRGAFRFIPRTFSSSQNSEVDYGVAAGAENIPPGRTSSAVTSDNSTSPSSVVADTAEAIGNNSGLWPPIIVGGVLALLLLGGERFLAMRRSN